MIAHIPLSPPPALVEKHEYARNWRMAYEAALTWTADTLEARRMADAYLIGLSLSPTARNPQEVK